MVTIVRNNVASESKTLPSASVIISTWNRLSFLKRLLDALSHLEDDDFELVIVNGPSSDGTDEFLESWSDRTKLASCPSANLSASRNLGVSVASGEILVFIDDDALPASSDWLLAYRRFFANSKNATCAVVGGTVINAIDGRREFFHGATSEYAEQSPQDGNVFLPASGGWVVRGVMGCNFAVRSMAAKQVGGFDENLSYYLEETDLCFRLSDRGYDIKFLEDNIVFHAAAPSSVRKGALRKNWRVISRSDTYFCIKNCQDRLLPKVAMILRTARWKHFPYLAFRTVPKPSIRWTKMVRYLALTFVGMSEGIWRGLFRPRRLRRNQLAQTQWQKFRAVKPEKKLRVGLISRELPGGGRYGGPGQHTDALAKGLYSLGHEIHLFVRPTKSLDTGGLDYIVHARPAAAEDLRFYDPLLPSTSGRFATSVDYHHAIEELSRQGKQLDVIIGCNWDLEALAVIRAQRCPVALILVTPLAHNLELGTFPESRDHFLWNSLDRWQILNAAIQCAPSHALLELYETLLDIKTSDLKALSVVPLGIERTYLPPLKQLDRKKLLFVGRLEKRKGVQVLLAALPAILAEFSDWECHFVGDDKMAYEGGPPIKSRFLRRNRNSPWLDRVRFHGYCSQESLHEHYRRCEIFVVPAIYESFGLAYHEAMQYGKPVIACRAGGMVETIADGVDGLLVPPEDVPALQEALRRLIKDPELRHRLGEAGAERIRTKDNHLLFAKRMEVVLLAHLGASPLAAPNAELGRA
jgi:hypothetical protein